jgi:hypothetical protein
MTVQPRTDDERLFLEALRPDEPPFLDVWPHTDADGTPWLYVSLSFLETGAVSRTLRMDYDGATMRGGWSPANLNWDDGVRAERAGIEAGADDGLFRIVTTPEEAGREARRWFNAHAEARQENG